MNIGERLSKKGDKIHFYYYYGRGPGQRPATGVWIYSKPKNQVQKNYNKEALKLLETKKSQLVIEQQSIGSAFMPQHKFKANFLDYYEEYVKKNRKHGNRHLENSLTQFKLFLKKDYIAPVDVTENLCKEFRKFLLKKYTGLTPFNYFARFKWAINAADSDGYFHKKPTENVAAKSNPSKKLKEHLEVEEYLLLLNTPCFNEEVKAAFIFCCYTGLRYVDVKKLSWSDIKDNILTTRIIQAKTSLPVTLTLHPIAQAILERQSKKVERRSRHKDLVFIIPSRNGANGVLNEWVIAAGVYKYITWSCARLSFSILLQDQNVDDATVAYLLGHATTKQVHSTYKRHRPKDQMSAISKLPSADLSPYFLNLQ